MAQIKGRRLTSPFLIGIFLIIGTSAIMAIIIWLGAAKIFQDNILYVSYFEGSVEGLENGSPVKYQGVPVGSVKSINLAPDGKLVEVVMQISNRMVVDYSLRVKAEISGLAGGKFLQLHYPLDSVSARNYPDIAFKPPYRLIPSVPSGIQEIENAARDVLTKLNQFRYRDISDEMISFLQTTTDFFKNEEFLSIVSNLDNASATLSGILNKADTSGIINNLSATSNNLMKIAVKLDDFADSLNFQLQEMQLARRIDNVMFKYDTTMNEAKKVVTVLGSRLESTTFYLNELIAGLRATSRQLQRSVRNLSDNPGRELLSEPPPPEK